MHLLKVLHDSLFFFYPPFFFSLRFKLGFIMAETLCGWTWMLSDHEPSVCFLYSSICLCGIRVWTWLDLDLNSSIQLLLGVEGLINEAEFGDFESNYHMGP